MRKDTLRRKLVRDMWKSRMQFVAVILLCALGTWVFSGLDAAWRMLDVSIESYFERQNLADFWVRLPIADRAVIAKLNNIDGVLDAQARISAELTADLPGDPSLDVRAFDGEPRINIPLVLSGDAAELGARGCLIENQFAKAHGLSVGNSIRIEVMDEKYTFHINGLVLSPEYVITAKDVRPDPESYGFMVLCASALKTLPFSEVVMTLSPGANEKAVESEITRLFPDALVVTREAHTSTQRTRNDVTLFKNMSYLFPLLAFAVAAMIVLTTITRMVENQRMQMGTLKALGYHDGAITRHYLSYAFYPSLVGALLGLQIGRMTLPYILWDMEAEQYILPRQIQAPVSLEAMIVCALAVFLSCGICMNTYRKSARESTAALLRPKPPKVGSRLLLERAGFIWKRLSFNQKLVMRNIFRTKSRTLMSLIGALCCNMMIITSLGLQDSVRFFVGNYYFGTLAYTVRADLTQDAGELEAYRKRLPAERVEGIMERTVSLRCGGRTRTTLMTVLCEDQTLLRLGENETLIRLDPGGIAVSRKVATVMGINKGDVAEIWLPGDDKPIVLDVNEIVTTNIGQGIYITRNLWKAQGKGGFTPTALLLLRPTERCIEKLRDMDELDALKWPDDQYEQTLGILQSMTGVFSLMSGAALGLAFVVLYNMGILNFMERSREYATLKVLGYHQKEIKRIMIDESNIITGLGVLMGILPGKWLTTIVLISCESDEMVFASTVEPVSILIASAVTFAFAYLIQRLLTRSVKKIDMVEALKSVE